jgi:NADH-quinone oxidoreductase subunit L
MVNFLDAVWLIPLFPLAGALVMLLAGRKLDPQGRHDAPRSKALVSLLCPGTVLVSFLFSLGAVWQLAGRPARTHQVVLYTWLAGLPFHTAAGALARFTADFGFLLDPLSSVMILVVTGIGFLIHLYSIGYMAHDGGYYRFFGYLNLFVFFMLMLVLANNYVLMFVGWEGVGLCSYLLIGFYFNKKSAADAGKKAFLVNRIGDAGFILGMLLMFSALGTARFLDVNRALANFRVETQFGVLTAIAVLLFVGATGKSAQLPLYVWLPDAMEGPTPVSALIHAATMVTAGVYMVARSNHLFRLAPEACLIVGIVGALTAFFAATIAMTQNDIKRVLAYSTVSQLGYMFVALGAGAYWAGIFHLYTHAFFKALLFLGSGSVIHALSGEQDMRKMGGLKKKIPVTYATMLIGTLAIAGVPGLAGFFSKDEILWQAFSHPGAWYRVIYALGIVTAGMTAFYMWRLMALTFYGESRVDPKVAAHIHESPKVMTVPLVVLAAGSVLAGWIGVPRLWSAFPDGFRAFETWLGGVLGGEIEREANTGLEWALMLLSVAVAAAGIALAWNLYQRKKPATEPLAALGPLYTGSLNKWYVDEAYNAVFVDGLTLGGGAALARFDQKVVDGGVNGAGWLTRATSTLSMWWDTWIVDGAVRLTAFAVKLSSYAVRFFETGSLQAYALVFVLGVAAILGYFLVRR